MFPTTTMNIKNNIFLLKQNNVEHVFYKTKSMKYEIKIKNKHQNVQIKTRPFF